MQIITVMPANPQVVYPKYLGAASDAIATALKRFDPDATWTALPPP
jgi:hypothetical protein